MPEPRRTVDGDLSVAVCVDGLDREVPAVIYRWLPDPVLGDRRSARAATAIGRAAAHLHRAGRSAPDAVRADRPVFHDVMLDSPDHLTPLLAAGEAAWCTNELRETIDAARSRIDDLTRPVLAAPDTMIHGDLHPWNVMWRDGHLSVFDFDDCGTGVPELELAISAYYLRARDGADVALLEGYRSVAPLDGFEPASFEAMIASRSILLLNDLVASETASLRDMVPDYAELTRRRLRHWLDTGRFRPDV